MVELRKRKAAPHPAPVNKRRTRTKALNSTSKATEIKNTATMEIIPKVGDIVNLDGFGGDLETNDGTITTLKNLLDDSGSGVVLFTYPKASTPGCKFVFVHTRQYKSSTSGGPNVA